MPSLPFTLRQLEVFASLAASGSFRASAEALGISQASVSNQLRVLEDQLGLTLFDRTPGRRPRLTAQGRAFHADLAAFDAAAAALARHRRQQPAEAQRPARFRLLVGQGMFDGYVRHKLGLFHATHPLIELEFETRPPAIHAPQQAIAPNFDFALINMRARQQADPALHCLARLRGGVYGHRRFLAGREPPLPVAELSGLPFFMPQAGSRQEAGVLAQLREAGVVPRKVVGHSQYYDVMAAMLEGGVAVATFADAILPPGARDAVVQLLPLEDWYLQFYRKPGLTDPRADAVADFLVRSVMEDPAYPAVERYPPPPATYSL